MVNTLKRTLGSFVLAPLLAACMSSFAGGQGGPGECVRMCKQWGMELTGMVGVAGQGRASGLASACVCERPRASGGQAAASCPSTAASGAIVALQQYRLQEQQVQSH